MTIPFVVILLYSILQYLQPTFLLNVLLDESVLNE